MLLVSGQRKFILETPGKSSADRECSVVNPTWIRTPLIEPLTSHPKFNDTVLEPEDVSKAVVDQVLSGRGGQLVLPASMSFLSGIRGWPTWLSTGLRNKASGESLLLCALAFFVPSL
jgi:hypothetical protein